MTLAELENLIREEIVLRGEYEGLEGVFLDKVQPLGLDIDDVRRLMEKVRVQLDNNSDLLEDLRTRIRTLGERRANRLTHDDLNILAADAARLYLTPDFVRNRWVPVVLNLKPATPPAPPTVPPPAETAPVAETPAPPPAETRPLLSDEAVRRKIHEILDEYDGHIPAQNLRFLFKAIDYDEQALAKKILAYLSENFYASVKPPKGATLKEKLLSTDWRHLSYWEREEKPPVPQPEGPKLILFEASPADIRRGEAVNLRWKAANTASVTLIGVGQNLPPEGNRTVVPAKTTTYTLRGQNGDTLGVVTVEVAKPSLLDRAGLWGVVLALLMLALTVWVIQYDPEKEAEERESRERKPRTSKRKETSARQDESRSEVSAADEPRQTGRTTEPRKQAEEPARSETAAESSRRPDYDQLVEGSGDFGEQPARKDGLWGLWMPDEKRWLIKPKYDDVTVFKDGRARVVLNGSVFDIDPSGERIED